MATTTAAATIRRNHVRKRNRRRPISSPAAFVKGVFSDILFTQSLSLSLSTVSHKFRHRVPIGIKAMRKMDLLRPLGI